MKIDEIALAGGAIRLTARNQGAFSSANTTAKREPARIITFAWGDRYVADLLSTTIPALLAPGNLPALTEHFIAELVIVTELRFFDKISCSPSIVHALNYCDARLIPIDDLLSPWYGISLTYALVRGFADLGDAMTETHLIFLNADFILADGSYRTLADKIRQGERLVVAPSYCMNLEATLPALQSHLDVTGCSLSVKPREMAALVMAHRHNTIRAKTINEKPFGTHRYDQFYWLVDDDTLLARQMPIAVVYMRPQRVLTEMPTFWDYGVISEYCPHIKPCVLSDSDDFLMAELRSESTLRESLRPDWPTIKEIAQDLSSFTTKDQREYGRYTLALHSADMPPATEMDKKRLDDFVTSIYEQLGPPLDYKHHPFWATAWPRYQTLQIKQQQKLRVRIRALNYLLASESGLLLTQRISELKNLIQNSETKTVAGSLALSDDARRAWKKLDILVSERNSAIDHILEDNAQWGAEERSVQSTRPASPSIENSLPLFARAKIAGLGWFTRHYHRFFGEMPHTTKWHPLHAVVGTLLKTIANTRLKKDVLVVSSGGLLTGPLTRCIDEKKLVISPEMVAMHLYGDPTEDARRFDLCFCDLSEEDMLKLRDIIEVVKPYLHPQGKIIVFHYVNDRKWFERYLREKSFPLSGTVQAEFTGSLPSEWAAKWYMTAIKRHDLSGLAGQLKLIILLLLIAPLARFGSYLETRRNPSKCSSHCTSMTIEIDIMRAMSQQSAGTHRDN